MPLLVTPNGVSRPGWRGYAACYALVVWCSQQELSNLSPSCYNIDMSMALENHQPCPHVLFHTTPPKDTVGL